MAENTRLYIGEEIHEHIQLFVDFLNEPKTERAKHMVEEEARTTNHIHKTDGGASGPAVE